MKGALVLYITIPTIAENALATTFGIYFFLSYSCITQIIILKLANLAGPFFPSLIPRSEQKFLLLTPLTPDLVLLKLILIVTCQNIKMLYF